MPSDACEAREVTALVLGAGEGQRLGGRPKALIDYHQGNLLIHSVKMVSPWAERIVIGVRACDLELATRYCRELPERERITCIQGGVTRQESLKRLLDHASTPYLLVHEVARPWAPPEDFRHLLEAVREHHAVVLYTPVPVRDSVATLDNGSLGQILSRTSLISLQTPHAYRRSLLNAAYEEAARRAWKESSTAALVKRAGYPVHLVEGSASNIKITYPEDLVALQTAVKAAQAEECMTVSPLTPVYR